LQKICVVEAAFSDKTLWVDGEPSLLAEMENVLVMNVSISTQISRESDGSV